MDLLPVGQTGSDKLARYVLQKLPISQNMILSNFNEDGVWFTAALTLTALRLPSDPLSDFLARRPDDGVRIFLHKQALFTGVGRPGMVHWDHAMFWCPKTTWEPICSHLAHCVFHDGAEYTYTQWLAGAVPDVLSCEKTPGLSEVPLVPVAVLGLRAPTWCHVVAQPEQNWLPLIIKKEKNHAD